MNVQVLKVPYDSGHRCERMARGPGYLLSKGVLPGVAAESIESGFLPEAECAFDLARKIAVRVQEITAAGDFPIVLSGNCNAAIGTLAGLGPKTTGVLWFDAHGEFHTPETTQSGFFDGMPLAVATGLCWRGIAGTIPGFTPIPAQNVVLVGVRQTEPEEQAALDSAGIVQVRNLAQLPDAMRALAPRIEQWYVHLDLDVLDPSEAVANAWVPPGGLRAEAIASALTEAASLRRLGAVGLASLDPACDEDGRALAVARRLLGVAASLAAAASTQDGKLKLRDRCANSLCCLL